ncbi:DotA/TraY family protein [Microvirga puerhi]|uniref:DotA/TraY family protein n=1 Tax=Microvirga puerhi TaxID=2876078 RepID=A0ABS7VTN1_9HYPH|nr:DotA/TraY family protein [Microvirga puerhi]MBZ6078934.1 DotA/TraY family protein [Microvirga puerhi]
MSSETAFDTGIFKPVQDDYAVTILERIFGSVVRAVADGTGLSQSSTTMLSQLIGVLNLAVMIFGAIVALYTTYSMIADTASDGEVLGNSADTKYTLIRSAVGAFLLIPVSGGFSIAQLIVIWLLVLGSGLGDTAWTRVAESALSGINYTAESQKIGASPLMVQVRQDFARALQSRTAGYLCQLHVNKVATTLGVSGQLSPVRDQVTKRSIDILNTRDVYETRAWSFSGSRGGLSGADSACGTVTLTNLIDAAKSNGAIMSAKSFSELLDQATIASAGQAMQSAITKLDGDAETIAQSIFSEQRNESKIRDMISTAVDEAERAYSQQHIESFRSSVRTDQLGVELLDQAKRNGWVFAGNWQRLLSQVYVRLSSGTNATELDAAMPARYDRIFGRSWWGGSTVNEATFLGLKADLLYLSTFDSTFAGVASAARDVKTIGQEDFSNGSQILSTVYNKFVRIMGGGPATNAWRDPMLDFQEVGSWFLTAGSAIKGATALASFIPNKAVAVLNATLDKFLDPISTALLLLGVAFTVVIPYIPLLYFIGAVVGWAILAVEAIFAIPVAVIIWFAPARQSSFIGSNHNVLLTLFGVLLRPIFIVIGLITAYILMRVSVDFINVIFSGIMNMVAPTANVASVFIFLGSIFIYLAVMVVTMLHICGLIPGLGDYALGWIGVGMSSMVKANPTEAITNRINPMGQLPGGGFGVTALGTLATRAALRGAGRSGEEQGQGIRKLIQDRASRLS